jgi:hypothetical protein
MCWYENAYHPQQGRVTPDGCVLTWYYLMRDTREKCTYKALWYTIPARWIDSV